MKIFARGHLPGLALLLASLSLFSLMGPGVPGARADLYKWEDSEGVLHITDDLSKVPESRRHGMKVFKIKPEPRKTHEPRVYIPATRPEKKKTVLYGGRPLDWWKAEFARLVEERDSLQDDIERKRQFISVFEGGRRFGQIFGEPEVARYREYKKVIETDRERLGKVEKELEKLRKEARIEEVPREIIPE